VATTLALAALAPRGAPARPELLASIVGVVTVAGVLAAAEVARAAGIEDPQTVVIDEVAGQLLAFVLVPLTVANLVLGTILFRIFDMWKPYPLRRLELLPRGVGIMADDLGAGLYANALLQLATIWLRG
jgi:phosphatidylglycerophosphatase A